MEQSVCKVEVGRDKHLSRRIAIVVLLIAALALPACTSVIGKRDESGGKLRVGIVFDIGGKDDKSFNAAAWEGVKTLIATRQARFIRDSIAVPLIDRAPGHPMTTLPTTVVDASRRNPFHRVERPVNGVERCCP